MVIFYGRYSIRTKTYTHQELNLPAEYSHLKFQLYQNFFFLFFIPVFPITKFWKVKNNTTDKEVGTDAQLRTLLNKAEARIKTPYWAYTGFIILMIPVLLLIGLLITNMTKEVSRSVGRGFESVEKRKENDKLNEETVALIKSAANKDTYHIKMIEMIPKINVAGRREGFKRGERAELTYTLSGSSEDSVVLQLSKHDYHWDKVVLKKEVTVAKQDLINIAGSYKTLYLYERVKINDQLIKAEAVFAIDRIESVDPY